MNPNELSWTINGGEPCDWFTQQTRRLYSSANSQYHDISEEEIKRALLEAYNLGRETK